LTCFGGAGLTKRFFHRHKIEQMLEKVLDFFGQLLEAEGIKSLVNTVSLLEKCQKGSAKNFLTMLFA